MLDTIKLALRISHSELDDEITATIGEARADMIRSGVPEAVAYNDDYPLTVACVKAYCQSMMTDDNVTSQRFWDSYQYQLDCMRKSSVPTSEGDE